MRVTHAFVPMCLHIEKEEDFKLLHSILNTAEKHIVASSSFFGSSSYKEEQGTLEDINYLRKKLKGH